MLDSDDVGTVPFTSATCFLNADTITGWLTPTVHNAYEVKSCCDSR